MYDPTAMNEIGKGSLQCRVHAIHINFWLGL